MQVRTHRGRGHAAPMMDNRMRRLRAIFANIRERLGVEPGGGRLKAAVVATKRGKMEARAVKAPENVKLQKRVQHIRQYQASILMRSKRVKKG